MHILKLIDKLYLSVLNTTSLPFGTSIVDITITAKVCCQLPAMDTSLSQSRHSQPKDTRNDQKASVATLFEQVGLHKILSLLDSDDANVRVHAVKVVANLAAEEANKKSIVEAGDLTSLLMLLRIYEDETVHMVAVGAIANLAMNEANQELIMSERGITLLSMAASDAEEPQTLRMVAGAIANLCGNGSYSHSSSRSGGSKLVSGYC